MLIALDSGHWVRVLHEVARGLQQGLRHRHRSCCTSHPVDVRLRNPLIDGIEVRSTAGGLHGKLPRTTGPNTARLSRHWTEETMD
jgi:hypothetical protein